MEVGNTKVSFIIPVKNGESTLNQCLESIFNQSTTFSFDVIVVNHESTDSSIEIASFYETTILNKIGGTIASVRNYGSSFSNAQYLAFVDSDCVLPCDWLDNAINYLESNPDYAAVGAGYKGLGKSFIEKSWLIENEFSYDATFITSGNFFIRSTAFFEIEGFDESLLTCEDCDICIRLLDNGFKIRAISEMKSLHLGTPKNVFDFYKKEKWYGSSHIYIINKNFLNDKIFVASLVFFFFMCISFVYLFISFNISLLFFLAACCIPFISTLRWIFKSKKHFYFFNNFILYIVYYIARTHGVINSITNLMSSSTLRHEK
jgi:glycosyltransferase involved in cell wall biosynthesis